MGNGIIYASMDEYPASEFRGIMLKGKIKKIVKKSNSMYSAALPSPKRSSDLRKPQMVAKKRHNFSKDTILGQIQRSFPHPTN